MTTFELGINTCFAVKRWPEPDAWAKVVREDLGLQLVQHSLDLVDLGADLRVVTAQAGEVQAACAAAGLMMDSTFTGLAAYSSNMLLDPRADVRSYWEDWFGRALSFSAEIGGSLCGGHVGAFSVRDWTDPDQRAVRWQELKSALGRLAGKAHGLGLGGIYIENLASPREPATMDQIDDLLTEGDQDHVPVRLCLDVGHQCVPGTTGPDRDPYAWLERYAARLGCVQLQQSDAEGDHHWPFTPERNAAGRIQAEKVLAALERGGGKHVKLILEVIPAFEQDDQAVVADLVATVHYWAGALATHRGAAPAATAS